MKQILTRLIYEWREYAKFFEWVTRRFKKALGIPSPIKCKHNWKTITQNGTICVDCKETI